MNPDDRSHYQPLASRAPQNQPDGQLDAQKKAEQIARDQAHHQYTVNAPNQLEAQQSPGEPYNQTQQPAYDWQQYHSAWQQYYQQYYQRYYAQELNKRAEAKRSSEEPAPEAPQLIGQTITGSDHIGDEPKTRFAQLRSDLLGTVRDRAIKAQKSNHFIPIVCAIIVGLLFLTLQFNRVLVAQVEAFISPGSTVDSGNAVVIDPSNTAVSKDPRLVIPKINIDVPVNYAVTTVDEKAIEKALEGGVVHYGLPGANSVPGQAGNGVILGHSSNDVFDPGNYKFAFLLLDRLKNGDLFYLNYNGTRYVYKVTDTKTITPSNWQVLQKGNGKPTMILVTCTPAGTALNRLLIYGEQISPDPATASAAPVNAHNANPAEIPGNSKTFFERLYDLFF